jgi:hypothetical protein
MIVRHNPTNIINATGRRLNNFEHKCAASLETSGRSEENVHYVNLVHTAKHFEV